MNLSDPIEKAALTIRQYFNFSLEVQSSCTTWAETFRKFTESIEASGILVMVSGVVGTNNRRKLNHQEFRGFALADKYAPLIFINGSDTKAAQIFTLAHELAHIWLGESALSDTSLTSQPSQKIEIWCNKVAAEFLVPITALKEYLANREHPLDAVYDLARKFKVSTLVILRRILDAGYITKNIFQDAYDRELNIRINRPKSGGGDFYLTQEVRASRRFVQALVVSTLEGQTLFRDAFQLLGIKKRKARFVLG
ncbi:MAG: ImmA/IrrE family metallo-endopeptidase [Desulfatiglans sp.]|jgi:Zn-dependent peptidase ImmA (M78 family)|nr:ImmA/IrrE family metallo-endopeptidase [Desulfatiglans sp.]